jgi:hypothetical protein
VRLGIADPQPTMMRLSASDLECRRPVWSALSELFLDTNLQDNGLDRITKVLAQSPYSIEQLADILLWEVYPACRQNVISIAGEWGGFDPEWLEAKIHGGPSSFGTLWASTAGRLGRFLSQDWRNIKSRVGRRRLDSQDSSNWL